ncbi:MAG: Rpn family recombination-promoting nuclease/putative transposase [Fibrobacter sp.]|nr:Rpn family recombination-promoting nuclease/putative transposase [Fibrobacter sp.]
MLKHGVSGDIIGTTNAGEKVLVEVQQQGDDFFRDRVEYYISRVIENQVHTSEKYELPRIYFLGLLDFELFPEEPQKYIHHVDEMCNGRKFFPKIQKIFVEIDKFFELEKAGITASDNSEAAQWLRAIKVIVKEEPVPEKIMQNETFRHLLDSVELINFVEELFNAEVKNMTDLKAEHEIGFSEGKTEGAAEERKKANEERLEMARASLAEGDSIEKVTRIFKLSENEVLAVQAKPTAQGK